MQGAVASSLTKSPRVFSMPTALRGVYAHVYRDLGGCLLILGEGVLCSSLASEPGGKALVHTSKTSSLAFLA